MKHLATCLFLILLGIHCQAQKLQLKLEGNSILETNILDSISYPKVHLDVKSIETETNSILEKLSKLGYLERKLIALNKINDTSFVGELNLGPRTQFIYLYIGTKIMYPKLNLFNQKTDTLKINYQEIESFLKQNLLLLEKQGFAFSNLKLKNIHKKNNLLYAELQLEYENKRRINKIIIKQSEDKNNGVIPKGYLKQINRKYKNKIYNQEIVNQINSEFTKIPFATPTKYPETLFTKDSTKIFVYLTKKKSNNFDGFIGFNNNASSKITLNGYLDLQLENIIQSGEQFSLYWKSDDNQQKTFKSSIEIPYLLKTPLVLKTQIEIFKQDSTFQNTKTNIDLGYYINYNNRIYLGFQSTASNNIQNTNTNSLIDFKNTFYTFKYEYTLFDNRNLIFPQKIAFGLKTGVGKRNSTSTNPNEFVNNQFYINSTSNYNFTFTKKTSIFIQNETYYLKSSSYKINELYRFGGLNSVRGFNENSFQASSMSAFLTEFRYLIAPNLYINSILDISLYKDPFSAKQTNKTSNLLGTGIGIGAITKGGLLKLSLANGTRGNEEFKFYNTFIHLSYNVKF